MNVKFQPSARTDAAMDAVAEAIKAVEAARQAPKKNKKKQKTPTYNFTLEQIESMKKDAVKRAVDEAVQTLLELTLGLPVMVLHDKHGWGKKRNGQFVDEVAALWDSYERGYITLEDVRDALWEEADVRIRTNKEGKR